MLKLAGNVELEKWYKVLSSELGILCSPVIQQHTARVVWKNMSHASCVILLAQRIPDWCMLSWSK